MTKYLDIILLIFAVFCVIVVRILSGLKSGCFYAVSQKATWFHESDKPPLLARFINNMHFVETPFWYATFFCFGALLSIAFHYMNTDVDTWITAIAAYLVTQGASAVAGPFYQGFINVGGGKPFVDVNENKSMELANPLSGKTKWIKRFWNGKKRILAAVAGLIAIIAGFMLGLNT